MKDSELTDPSRLASDYYKTPERLDARIDIYRRFLHSPQTWQQWLFNRLPWRADHTVMDVGCGTGEVWAANIDRIPSTSRITLCDLSEGMIEACRARFTNDNRFRFVQADLNSGLPGNDSYSLVVACHVVYHIRNLDGFLRSVRARLCQSGAAVITTVGPQHMQRVSDLVNTYEGSRVTEPTPQEQLPVDELQMLLERHFERVEVKEFAAELRVTDAEPLIRYVLASRPLCGDRYETDNSRAKFAEYVYREVEREVAANGYYRIAIQNVMMTCLASCSGPDVS